MPFKHAIITGLWLTLFSGCSSNEEKMAAMPAAAPSVKEAAPLKYARRFAIEKSKHYTLVHVFGNRAAIGDTTATYLICPDTQPVKDLPKHFTFIKSPCRKIAALSSIYANIIYDLHALDQLVAIDAVDYVINPQIRLKHAQGKLAELAKGPEIDLEQTITLRPDIVFTYGMGEPGRDVNPKLVQSGIPVAVSLDHLEETPLARAEWIKFYGAFINKSGLADSIFNATEKHYMGLQAVAKRATWAPTVFNEIKYGDTWYVPGGKSYMAQLLHDAATSYIWKDDPNTGSLPLSFEQVYTKARNADFWINLSTLTSKRELLGYESRYAEFKAFKTDHLYNNNKVTNNKGYSTYWETAMIYPDRILSDLLHIFHPELMPEAKSDLYYYRQIK